MPRFLSPEWIAEADAAAAASAELARATAEVQLVVRQVVTDGPDGDVCYVVSIDRGRTELRSGDQPLADVTIRLDWDTAVALATGAASAEDAFTTGRLELRGDVAALLRHGPALVGLDSVFAELRASTTY